MSKVYALTEVEYANILHGLESSDKALRAVIEREARLKTLVVALDALASPHAEGLSDHIRLGAMIKLANDVSDLILRDQPVKG